jgi:HdeA/HdeB family
MKTMTKGLISRTVLGGLVIAAAFSSAKAQTIIEMSALKCGDYLEAPARRQEQFAAWMSGYFNAERNMSMVDLEKYAANRKRVEEICRRHREDNFMNVFRREAL